jgi:hypothetical protein
MTDQVAGAYIFEQVSALFAARADRADTLFKFGWKEPDKKIEGMVRSKITFVPGDTGGKLGKLGMAKYPGESGTKARPLGSLGELFTIYVFAFDRASPESEIAQYNACRLLWDDLYAAMWRVYHGHFSIDDLVYSHKTLERKSGCEIRALLNVIVPLPDTFDESTAVFAQKASGVVAAPDGAAPYEVTLP